MSEQPHLLIAGATGSGKSVVINGIMHAILHRSPNAAQLILIDPKRVELVMYKDLPHCVYVSWGALREVEKGCCVWAATGRGLQQLCHP